VNFAANELFDIVHSLRSVKVQPFLNAEHFTSCKIPFGSGRGLNAPCRTETLK
jgi:hypothetical protein